ncbi:protein lev-9-like [Argopecten irradians]|uniref:protein lev-9-like n=1 Tax=Argopecten irradians TaxID=31199 RepID=UPI0037115580
MDTLTEEKTSRTKMRCASLCVELGCNCTSYVYDSSAKTCYMFNKALISGNGDKVAYNKLTECATPRHISNATLQQYTGCNAEYECDFGYKTSPPDAPNEITCQSDETWAPINYACVLIPCTSPPPLSNGIPHVTSLSVGGTTTYAFDTHYINTGGGLNTRTCVLGGTWAGEINMECTLKPCESPIAITNGNVDASSLSVGSVATFTCDSTFINTGGDSSTLTCILGGTWSGTIAMVCSPTRTYHFVMSVKHTIASDQVYMIVYGQEGFFEFTFPSSVPLHMVGETVYEETFLDVGDLTKLTIGFIKEEIYDMFILNSMMISVEGLTYALGELLSHKSDRQREEFTSRLLQIN